MRGICVATVTISLGLMPAAHGQQVQKGEIATVDAAAAKIGIKQSSSDTAAPSPGAITNEFKVQDGLVFNDFKPGDKVSFTAEKIDGAMTIRKLTKE